MSDIITASDPSRLPWEMTLAEIIDSAAERHPDKVFLRYDKYAVTYGEFQEATRRVAQTFSRLGVGRGDRVCLFLPNGREDYQRADNARNNRRCKQNDFFIAVHAERPQCAVDPMIDVFHRHVSKRAPLCAAKNTDN